MHVAFLSPRAGVVALAVVVPLAAYAAARARDARTRAALGVRAPALVPALAPAAALVLTLALVGVAAAQPVIQHGVPKRARTDAQVYVVFDISRSMSAAPAAHEPDRLDRAKRFALSLRARLANVPVGVASLTDRVLPLQFPSVDAGSFASVVRRAVQVDEPAPQRYYTGRATSFGALQQFADEYYFDASARRRALVVLTDGETLPLASSLAAALQKARIRVVFVDVGDPSDRVWTTSLPDPNYRPDPNSGATLERIASTLHGSSVGEHEVGRAAAATTAALRRGPVAKLQEPARVALMPWVTLASFLPLGFLIWRRNR
jgi:hypothetical protein